MYHKKSKKTDASYQALSPKDRTVFSTIEDYMNISDREDASFLSANMLIILSSHDKALKHELHEIARRIGEKQWEDDDRAFKKNIFMIIEALAEDI